MNLPNHRGFSIARQRADPISIVEAAYDLVVDEATWLTALAHLVAPVLDRGLGVVAYEYAFGEDPVILHTARARASDVAYEGLRAMRVALSEPAHPQHTAFRRSVFLYQQDSRQALTYAEFLQDYPDGVQTLGETGVGDVMYLRADAVDGTGAVVFAAGSAGRVDLQPAERGLLHRLGAHIKAGARLRRRGPEVVAIIDPLGRVLHAEGEARLAVRQLKQASIRVETSRSRRGGRDGEALRAWHGLIEGRWSLVEQVDTDGKRLLVVHQNPVGVTDPRGLTRMERDVVGLAVQGHGDKMIAYHLGLASGTVSAHLSRAMRKLGVRNRIGLVRLLAGRWGHGSSTSSRSCSTN